MTARAWFFYCFIGVVGNDVCVKRLGDRIYEWYGNDIRPQSCEASFYSERAESMLPRDNAPFSTACLDFSLDVNF